MLEVGDLLTLSNKKEYIVIKQIQLNGKNYVYLVTKDGISDIAICEYETDKLTIVKDEKLIHTLVEKFKELKGE